LRVAKKGRASDSVVSLELIPADNRPLAISLPGQYVIVRLQPRPDRPLQLRSYSLCGPPGAGRFRLGIKREGRASVSDYLCDEFGVGETLEVSAPRGGFTLRPGDRPVVLISAGIGVTPVLAMLHALAAGPSEREVWWLHGARNGSEHPFDDEARGLIEKLPRGRSHIRFSRPRREDRPGADFDAPGRLDAPLLQRLGIGLDADFYLCGPSAFLEDFTAGLAGWGVERDRVNTEVFGPGGSSAPGLVRAARRSPHLPAGPRGAGPRISFARSGLEVAWDPAFMNLLELAEACDVPARWSCRTGVCHACETALVAGEVKYDPRPLDLPADGNLLICCSCPEKDVILDL
jgi:ferredoxin-NADP reductase